LCANPFPEWGHFFKPKFDVRLFRNAAETGRAREGFYPSSQKRTAQSRGRLRRFLLPDHST
jgi:hypothetical protein